LRLQIEADVCDPSRDTSQGDPIYPLIAINVGKAAANCI
jgi:hypothetical protein